MANLIALWEQRKYYPTQSFDSWCQQELQIRFDAEESTPSASTNSAMNAICPYYKKSDMVHAGDKLGIAECTCNGRPGKQHQ